VLLLRVLPRLRVRKRRLQEVIRTKPMLNLVGVDGKLALFIKDLEPSQVASVMFLNSSRS
jgi:hypothetical protein